MLPPDSWVLGPDARRWVAAAIHPRARVVRVRRLVGGVSSAVQQVTVARPDGARLQLVLRRWLWDETGEKGTGEMQSEWVRREAAILDAVSRTGGVPAPKLVAFDPSGASAGGAPSLLMTKPFGPGRSQA